MGKKNEPCQYPESYLNYRFKFSYLEIQFIGSASPSVQAQAEVSWYPWWKQFDMWLEPINLDLDLDKSKSRSLQAKMGNGNLEAPEPLSLGALHLEAPWPLPYFKTNPELSFYFNQLRLIGL